MEKAAVHSSPSHKRDNAFVIEYFFSVGPEGGKLEQADRDFVAQVIDYFSWRTKQDLPVGQPILSNDIQGVTTNRDADKPVRAVFQSEMHFLAMYAFLQRSREQHNNMIVNVHIDGLRSYFRIW